MPAAGAIAGLGSGALSDLRRWIAHTQLNPLIQQIADGIKKGLDSNEVNIGTIAEMRDAMVVPIPDQPYVVLDGDGGSYTPSWWHGNQSMDGWNAVPGLPGAPCYPGLIVTPFIECKQRDVTYKEHGYDPMRSWEIDHSALYEFRTCTENYLRWEVPNPKSRLPSPFSEYHHDDVWNPRQKCFIEILEEAICHLLRCPAERVVVDLTQLGQVIGLDRHPALRCFEQAVRMINHQTVIVYRYSPVNGLL
jgi:hypothetical protein